MLGMDGICLFWELFRFRNERNIIPFILLPIYEQNGRNKVYSESTEYAFFWEIFGGKSYAASDIVVLRSPPIPFPDLKHKERSFRN